MDTPSKVTVRLYGHGNVVSFKNKKRIIPGRNGSPPLLVTKPEAKKQMEAIIRDIVSLLISASQTSASGTSTASSRRSSIALLLPEDDSRQWIPRILIECSEVAPGEEGVPAGGTYRP
jgi:hypothetical protein